KLRVREMEAMAEGTTSGATLAKPDDLAELQRLAIYPAGREIELEYISHKTLAKFSGTTGMPQCFTMLNRAYYLAPAPDGEYSYTALYYLPVPPLETHSRNWLLTAAPDVCLYGALLEAAPYVRDDKRVAMWADGFNAAIAELTAANDRIP